jgi:hypothetical protein
VTTVAALSSRLRAEIGDTGRSFVDTFTGDSVTTRYQLSQAPVQGSTLSIRVAVAASTAQVTAASASSGTVTYTAANSFVAGQTVSITGLSTTAFNLSNVTVAYATPTYFSVTSTATGTAVTVATAVARASSYTSNVSSTSTIEEGIGVLTLASAPISNAVITITGTAYRYFTDNDITYYVNTAFAEHARTTTDSNGSLASISTLPLVEEYPLVIHASTLALYTLANDAAFDIDIISPDGVSIPRSERYRQLTEIIQQRKEQYRELCSLLNIGMHRIEVFSLRRISRTTNRYIPIYRPQEVDDGSIPIRISLPIPNYGDVTPNTPAIAKDLSIYAGDDFLEIVKFSMDLTAYTPLAQIRLYPSIPGSAVGPVILGSFTFTKTASVVGGIVDTLNMSLPGSTTANLPNISYYDLQLTAPDNSVKTYIFGKVFTHYQVSSSSGLA